MTTEKHLNQISHQLSVRLADVKSDGVFDDMEPRINVARVGREVSVAYEQLRNAAEYVQEHLLIQNAIRRFYVRNLSFQNMTVIDRSIAEELIFELIQSGYIENDTQPLNVIEKLGNLIKKHYSNYWRLKDSGVKSNIAQKWTLDLLSVDSEKIVIDDTVQTIFVQFAYNHYKSILRKDLFLDSDTKPSDFEASLYVAVYKSLFKSDLSSVRCDMQRLYSVSDLSIMEYSNFHNNIDIIFESDLTEKLERYINKFGAPLRILKNLVQSDADVSEILKDSDRFHASFSAQINKEYNEAREKLNKGLIKSIIFLLITKALIGVLVEVPYDVLLFGDIIWVPLIINLLTPVVYMALLRFGLKLPSVANTKAIQHYADNMLYGDPRHVNLYPLNKNTKYPVGFKVAYILMFLLAFGLVVNLLIYAQFNIVQGAIFFVFFATANFLGFRLSGFVRDLELVTAKSGLIMTLRDFLYMPFILLGQWLSEKYKKVNIVALVLDTIIELPLKTVLRLIRQWVEFINDKKDQI
jgi:hypothetical protein